MTSAQWISLVAALGIGSIVAAILSRWSVISNLRQRWIDALRDDLCAYLKEIDAMHFRVAKFSGELGEVTIDDLEKQQETRNAALLVYRRILLRLNVKEKSHTRLAESLKHLLLVKGSTADSNEIDKALMLARQILKQEWRVTKYGILAKFKRPYGRCQRTEP